MGLGLNLADRLLRVMQKECRLVVGAMSGTSADGVDVAAVELCGHGRGMKWKLVAKGVVPYPAELKREVLLRSERGSVRDVCLLNYAVAAFFAKAIKEVLELNGLGKTDVDVVGAHGQTLYHIPEYVRVGGIPSRCSLQVGSPSVIAEHTGIITVGDFRSRDIAAGGQGAPIIAYVDWALLTSDDVGRLVQNIGGIANVTVLPAGGRPEDVYAFDTGPGNMVVDELMRMLYGSEYDAGGHVAMRGSVDERLLEELMAHPFIRSPPPKTASRREFGRRFAEYVLRRGLGYGLSKEDLVATATRFTVKSIVYNYDRYILRYGMRRFAEVIVGGGGVRNEFLMKELRRELAERGLKLLTHEEVGIDSKYKEALGMAVLAHEALSGVPNNIPRATGATRRVVMGTIAL